MKKKTKLSLIVNHPNSWIQKPEWFWQLLPLEWMEKNWEKINHELLHWKLLFWQSHQLTHFTSQNKIMKKFSPFNERHSFHTSFENNQTLRKNTRLRRNRPRPEIFSKIISFLWSFSMVISGSIRCLFSPQSSKSHTRQKFPFSLLQLSSRMLRSIYCIQSNW